MLYFFCSLDGEQTPLGTFSLNHFHHPWGDFIQDSSILHNTLFTIVFTIHPNLSFFFTYQIHPMLVDFHSRKERATMCFLSHRCQRAFLQKIFFLWYHCHPPLDIIWSSSIHVTKLCLLFIHLRNIFKPSESRCWNHPSLDIETKCLLYIHPYL